MSYLHTNPVDTYPMAVMVVTETNTIVVLTVITIANVMRASVLYMAVAQVKSVHVHLHRLTAAQ